MNHKLLSLLIASILLILSITIVSSAPIMLDYTQLPHSVQQEKASSSAVPCEDGFAGIYPCDNVDLLAFISFEDMEQTDTRGTDIWGWYDQQNGDEYVIHALRTGTAFFRITDPENPVYLGFLPTHTVVSNWRDVKVYSNHAYIVSEAEGHGLQIIDLTQLRGITTTQSFTNTAHYDAFGSAHNIVINEGSGFAYAVGAKGGVGLTDVEQNCAGGLHMIDISVPAAPVNVGCFDEDGYTHDAQCVIYKGPDSRYTGREICFNSNEDTLTIVDVSDKNNPVMLSRTSGFEGCVTRTTCYTHQGWLTEDQAHFLINDELDEQQLGVPTTTYIWDVAMLDNPVMTTTYAPGIPSIDHNLYVRDETAFLSNYTSGLRIVNITNRLLPREIAFFDVYPANDDPLFTGTWSNYPYFESGVIAVSSIDRGLFLLKPDDVLFKAADTRLTSCEGTDISTTLSTYSIFDPTTANLATLNIPAGVRVLLDDQFLDSGKTTTMRVDNLSKATSNFTITITGSKDGAVFTSETVDIIMGEPNEPAMPVSPSAFSIDNIPRVTFVWNAQFDATSYRLEVSNTADFNTILQMAETEETEYELNDLPENNQLYWRVIALNACGETASAATPFIIRSTTSSCTTTYANTFENGEGDWTTPIISQRVNSWTLTNTVAYGGTHSWYAPDSDLTVQLLSSEDFLPEGDKITLSFWQQRHLDMGGDVGQFLLNVEDSGFFVAEEKDLSEPYNSVTSYWRSTSSNDLAGWSGDQAWTQTMVDLTAYSGRKLSAHFLLLTDNIHTNNNTVRGWAIDNVEIESCTDVPIAADFSDLPASYGIAWHIDDGRQRIGETWDSDTVLDIDNDLDDMTIPLLMIGDDNNIVLQAAVDGWVDMWFDWNEDGTFTTTERAVSQPLTAGENNISLTVPTINQTTRLAYRIRVSADTTASNINISGQATSGEVEDGYVELMQQPAPPTAISLMMQPLFRWQSQPMMVFIASFMMAAITYCIIHRNGTITFLLQSER